MKNALAAVAVAASAVAGLTAVSVPAAADAQPRFEYGRPYYGPVRGAHWRAYRRGYYGRYHRYPVRVCHRGRCWWR